MGEKFSDRHIEHIWKRLQELRRMDLSHSPPYHLSLCGTAEDRKQELLEHCLLFPGPYAYTVEFGQQIAMGDKGNTTTLPSIVQYLQEGHTELYAFTFAYAIKQQHTLTVSGDFRKRDMPFCSEKSYLARDLRAKGRGEHRILLEIALLQENELSHLQKIARNIPDEFSFVFWAQKSRQYRRDGVVRSPEEIVNLKERDLQDIYSIVHTRVTTPYITQQ